MPPLPLHTISSFSATFNPFSRLSRPCRLFLALLQTPSTINASSPTHIKVSVKRLPRTSTQLPEMTVGFRNGKELKLEVGRLNMSVHDAVEEVARIGRVIAREDALKS